MCVLVFFFFHSHPLENGCLSEVQGVVGMVEARLHFADTQPALSCPDRSKWPCQAAISWDLLLQYRGIKAFYEAFSQPKVYAVAACVPFSTTRMDIISQDA